jgi:LuxR family maltose regulon positive regulatory protein
MRPAVGANIDHPTITGSVCAAAVHLYQGDYAAAAGEVYAARRLLLADSDDTTTEAVLALFEATLSRARGDFPTAGKRARHVLDRLDHHEQTAPAAALRYRAMALCEVGTAHVWNGRSGDAADFLRAGSAQAERLGLDLSHASALAHLALVDVIDGDLNQAEKRVVMAAEMIDQPGASAPRLVEGQLALALIHLCRGEWADADWRLARGLAVGERNVDRATWLALRVAQARIQLGRGQVISSRRAVAWVRDQIDGGGVRSLLLDRWISLADADVLLAAGQPARAIDRLEQRPRLCSQERVRLARAMLALGRVANAEATVDSVLDGPALADVGTAVEAWLVRALVAEHRRCDNAAAEACAQALELAESQGFRLPFLVLGGAVARQLHREMQLIGDHPEFIADILACLGAGTGHADPPIEPLTDRQMAILRWLPSMRGNQEIADELFVTVNTVKAHLKALYRKLGVTSRREAVARAKERGLI